MAEAEGLELEEESVVALKEKHLPATDGSYVRVSCIPREAEKYEDESDSVIQPLLQHKHQDSCDENHKADMQTATAGANQKTSVPQEPELAVRDEPDCNGSVRSLCSNSSQHECPICRELFDSHGDHHVTLLNCDHKLCQHCIAGIMRRSKEPGRLRCPFCRQTTPFPQWEIRRLQEELYSGGVYEAGPALIISPGPELEADPVPPLERQLEAGTHTNIGRCCGYPSCLVRGWRLMRPHSPCLSTTVLLLLFLVLLGCFLYVVVPIIMLFIFFS